ncbi:MAG TPA: MTH938/NDUFAF3 family protein [Candidatus Binatia bacterium]|nr:MTH938/NDUFAF3 family protein [Candidatus Binatia bacterium]
MQSFRQIAFAFAVFAVAFLPARQVESAEQIRDADGKGIGANNSVAAGRVSERPRIESSEFGVITIGGRVYRNDVIIRLDGKVEKRKKGLSKQVYHTSHLISLDEAKHLYEEGAERLIIGSGHSGMVKLSDEAAAYFKGKGCSVELAPTPAAIQAWNQAKGNVIGLFHITC